MYRGPPWPPPTLNTSVTEFFQQKKTTIIINTRENNVKSSTKQRGCIAGEGKIEKERKERERRLKVEKVSLIINLR